MPTPAESYFFQLVLMLETAALQQLGKIKNPLTKKNELNLEQAKYSIDLLGMLEEKTRGNLTEGEEKYFQDVLAQLRLLYVEEKGKSKTPAPENPSGKGST
jgi:hypothetical protein